MHEIMLPGFAILLSMFAIGVSIWSAKRTHRIAEKALSASVRPFIDVTLSNTSKLTNTSCWVPTRAVYGSREFHRCLIAKNVGSGHAYDLKFEIKAAVWKGLIKVPGKCKLPTLAINEEGLVPTKIFVELGQAADYPMDLEIKISCKDILGERHEQEVQTWQQNEKMSSLFKEDCK